MKSGDCPWLARWMVSALALVWVFMAGGAKAQSVQRFDLTDSAQAQAWAPMHDIARATPTPDGLKILISGSDPYLYGPQRDYPAGQPLWLRIRLKSDQGGTGQVYYYTETPTEPDSVRFPVRSGRWEELKVPLPPLGNGYHLRLDPPGASGTCVVSAIEIMTRMEIKQPVWPLPTLPDLGSDALTIRSGNLQLEQAHHQFGGCRISVSGQTMAVGYTHPMIGYLYRGEPRWMTLDDRSIATAAADQRGGILTRVTAQDQDGGTWDIEQQFSPGRPGEIQTSVVVRVDQDRTLLFLPLLTLFPGMGTFGESKNQALFAGLEYLDRDEPSSSEADLTGPAARRQAPDPEKVTLPLMVIQQNGRYVGLTWEQTSKMTPLFDSPDRLFHSGGHVMALIAPGFDGSSREEGSLLPYDGLKLGHDQAITLNAAILGGMGENVTPALQQAVAIRGLPAVPSAGIGWKGYMDQTASGWLDSGLRVGSHFRHAYPDFDPQPAADAATMLEYLAADTRNAPRSARLSQAARDALRAVPPGDLLADGVGHVRTPAPMLAFGHISENMAHAGELARSLSASFEPDGTVRYHPPADGPDLARTHFAPDASGLTAQVVLRLLENAIVSGNADRIGEGLRRLHDLDRYRNTVPRGAQSWEVPLHTPDILAAAYLTRAYTLGYELTGDAGLLGAARYWAWTGVPFVYLDNPTGQRVGPYSTIAVYGATHWVAPVWMGLPVQWCGLVYADALYGLIPYDPSGPWKRLADGITSSGVQQTWPRGMDPSRQGLLPDSFDLRSQTRNDPAINPATLFVDAVRLYDQTPLYGFHVCRASGLLVHAPGRIESVQDGRDHVSFSVQAWPKDDYSVLITGLKTRPRVRVNGRSVATSAPNDFSLTEGRLILRAHGNLSIRIDLE